MESDGCHADLSTRGPKMYRTDGSGARHDRPGPGPQQRQCWARLRGPDTESAGPEIESAGARHRDRRSAGPDAESAGPRNRARRTRSQRQRPTGPDTRQRARRHRERRGPTQRAPAQRRSPIRRAPGPDAESERAPGHDPAPAADAESAEARCKQRESVRARHRKCLGSTQSTACVSPNGCLVVCVWVASSLCPPL